MFLGSYECVTYDGCYEKSWHIKLNIVLIEERREYQKQNLQIRPNSTEKQAASQPQNQCGKLTKKKIN